MKIKTVIGVLGLVLLIGMGVALALTPPPPPNMENGVSPSPAGKIELKAALVYGERCVAVLTLYPETGRPLPLGWRPLRGLPVAQWRAVKGILPSVVRRLKVLDGAEYLERENGWAVPIAYRGEVVARLRVTRDGKQVIPDYPAEQEMRVLGK